MVNVTSIYPRTEESFFDRDYYATKHMPFSISLLSTAKGYRGVSVEIGVDSPDGAVRASFHAMCHYYFDSVEYFLSAFMPHRAELEGDIEHYTNVRPINQINEVVIFEQKG